MRPWIVAEKEGGVVSSHCDCQAGLGEVCTHISALLFSIEAVTRIRDEKTVTQKPAYWKLPAELKKIDYNRLCEIDLTSAKSKKKKLDLHIDSQVPNVQTPKTKQKEIPDPTCAEMTKFYDELWNTNTKPVVLSTIEPYCSEYIPRTVSAEFPLALGDLYDSKLLAATQDVVREHCANLYKSLNVTSEQANNVQIATRQQSKTKLWHKFRAGRVTASKARSVVKTNISLPSKTLIKSICYPDLMKFSTQATRWGCDNESTAKSEFKEKMMAFHENFTVDDCGFFIDPNNFYIGASPDAIVSCDCCGSFLLEVKCPFSAKECSIYEQQLQYLERRDDGRFFLKKDHPYYFQVQTQLGVTGKDMCYFVVWSMKDIHVERILFDEDMYEEICSKAKTLFKSFILPELVAKLSTRRPVLQAVKHSDFTNKSSLEDITGGPDESNSDDIWCYCRKGESGKMIACDNENCVAQWFHIDCVGLNKVPRGKWYCKNCQKTN